MTTSKQKIRIVLKSYDHTVLDTSAEQIVEAAERTGAAVAGPIPLPTAIKRFCVIRSPHVDKNYAPINDWWILWDQHPRL